MNQAEPIPPFWMFFLDELARMIGWVVILVAGFVLLVCVVRVLRGWFTIPLNIESWERKQRAGTEPWETH